MITEPERGCGSDSLCVVGRGCQGENGKQVIGTWQLHRMRGKASNRKRQFWEEGTRDAWKGQEGRTEVTCEPPDKGWGLGQASMGHLGV